MNKERVQQAIDIMTRAGLVDMSEFQGGYDRAEYCITEQELHKCGTSACFAGWVAVSPEFHEAGGWVTPDCPSPRIRDGRGSLFTAENAIAEWLGINVLVADCFIYGQCEFYGDCMLQGVTREQVIERLEQLRDGAINPDATCKADLFF